MRKVVTWVLIIMLFLTGCKKSDETEQDGVSGTKILFNQGDYESSEEFRNAIKALDSNKVTNENVFLSIPSLSIGIAVLEGTDDYTLDIATGHIEGTGAVGTGNYCIAGHTGDGNNCFFNGLDTIEYGDRLDLISKEGICYTYYTTQKLIVEPEDVWVTTEFSDNRLTLITCTEDGNKRLVVVGMGMTEGEYIEYARKEDMGQIEELRIFNSQFSNICISDYFENNWRC